MSVTCLFHISLLLRKKNPDIFILICNVDCDKNFVCLFSLFTEKKCNLIFIYLLFSFLSLTVFYLRFSMRCHCYLHYFSHSFSYSIIEISYFDICCFLSSLYRKISDAGSQYRWGRVGRGLQPPSTPQVPHSHTQNASNTLIFALFNSCSRTDGPTDRRTNGKTDE